MAKRKENFIDENALIDLAELFKIFADSTRIKILFFLFKNKNASVKKIAQEVNISQSAASHQMRLLKNGLLVKKNREGQSSIYSLADSHVVSILSAGFEHILEKNKKEITYVTQS